VSLLLQTAQLGSVDRNMGAASTSAIRRRFGFMAAITAENGIKLYDFAVATVENIDTVEAVSRDRGRRL
jgi:hypothetical protein